MHSIRIPPRIDLSYIYKLHVHIFLKELYYRYSQIGSGPYIRNAQQYERDTVGHLETNMHICWLRVLGLWFIIPNTNANLNTALTHTRNQELNSHRCYPYLGDSLFLVHLWVGRSKHLPSWIKVFAVRPTLNISVHSKYVFIDRPCSSFSAQ